MKKSYENGYWSKITYWTCKLNESTHFNNLKDTQVAIEKLQYFTQKQADKEFGERAHDVSKEGIVDILVKEFGATRSSFYNTDTNKQREKFWTYNRCVKYYSKLRNAKDAFKAFEDPAGKNCE